MSVEDFIDSNVFIYMFDETDAHKRQLAENLVRRSLEDSIACISYQVVQETMNIVIGKLGATPETARLFLEDVLTPLWGFVPKSLIRADFWNKAGI